MSSRGSNRPHSNPRARRLRGSSGQAGRECAGAGQVLAAGMSALVVATGFGGPEVLSVIDEPAREPGPGEVRIEVRAAGVNPIDYKQYSGAFGKDEAQLPMRLGMEAAGVVTAVGPDAHGAAGPLAVGDEVVGFRVTGAYAAELVTSADVLLPKPAGLSWEAAGGLLLTGVTAAHCMAAGAVQAGDTVLVHGGAGGVGLVLVQLAVQHGATVIATASPARHEVLQDLGAVPVVLRRRPRRPRPRGRAGRHHGRVRPRRDGRGARHLGRTRRRPRPHRHHRGVRARRGARDPGDRRRPGRRPRHRDPQRRPAGARSRPRRPAS